MEFEENKDKFFQLFEEKKTVVVQTVIKNKILPFYNRYSHYLKNKKLGLYREFVFQKKNFESFSFEKLFEKLKKFMNENKDFDNLIKSDINKTLMEELHEKLMIQFNFLVAPSKGDSLKKIIKKLLK